MLMQRWIRKKFKRVKSYSLLGGAYSMKVITEEFRGKMVKEGFPHESFISILDHWNEIIEDLESYEENGVW